MIEELGEPEGSYLPAKLKRILAALDRTSPGQSPNQIQDRVANDGEGPPLKTRTVQRTLVELEAQGLVEGTPAEPGVTRYWRLRASA